MSRWSERLRFGLRGASAPPGELRLRQPRLLARRWSALAQIARAHGKSAAQAVLRWRVQKGNIVFPKSTNPAHIADNIDIFDFELTEGEVARIAALDKGKSYFNWPEWLERVMYKLSDKTPFGERD